LPFSEFSRETAPAAARRSRPSHSGTRRSAPGLTFKRSAQRQSAGAAAVTR
jgi:hypothetical protein